VRFLVPKAAREEGRFALICALLTALLCLLVWLFVGVAPAA
jgi:hypothetical protein